MNRPKPDASTWYKQQKDTTDKYKVAQQAIRDKLGMTNNNSIEQRKSDRA